MFDQRLWPYYMTRALMSLGFGIWAALALHTWMGGLLFGLLLFGGFLWYAHSGWYLIDLSTPLFPLRRDERGQSIRNQALVFAVAVGGIVFGLSSVLTLLLALKVSASGIALFSVVGCYVVVTIWRFLHG